MPAERGVAGTHAPTDDAPTDPVGCAPLLAPLRASVLARSPLALRPFRTRHSTVINVDVTVLAEV